MARTKRTASRLWDGSKRPEVTRILAALLKRMTPKGIRYELQTTLYLRALLAWSTETRLIERDIFHVLRALKKSRRRSIGAFEEEWNRLRSRQRKVARWTFYIPLQFTHHRELSNRSVSLLCQRFRFTSWSAAIREIGSGRFWHAARFYRGQAEKSLDVCCVRASAFGVTATEAWSHLHSAFDLLRGLLEAQRGWNRISLHGGPKAHPRRQCPHPAWLIGAPENGPAEFLRFHTDSADSNARPQLSAEQAVALKRIAHSLFRDPRAGALASMLADAFRIYVDALDELRSKGCFLGLWRLAERLTLSEHGDTKVVCKRLAWFSESWTHDTVGYVDILRTLAEKRNNAVHRGLIDDIDDEDVNLLKLTCESAINWLIEHIRKLPTEQHLREFYSLRPRSARELRAVEQAAVAVRSTYC